MQREPHSLNFCGCRPTTAAEAVGWFDVIVSIIAILWCNVVLVDEYGGVYSAIVQTLYILILVVYLGLLVGIGKKLASACLLYIIYKAFLIHRRHRAHHLVLRRAETLFSLTLF